MLPAKGGHAMHGERPAEPAARGAWDRTREPATNPLEMCRGHAQRGPVLTDPYFELLDRMGQQVKY